MLAAAHRLRESDAFGRTVRTGRRAGTPMLVVHVAARSEASDDPPVRVGLIVSRAVGNAVVRNRVKRRLRHLLRARLAELPAGGDVVVRALPAAADASSAELDAALTRSLSRVGSAPVDQRSGR